MKIIHISDLHFSSIYKRENIKKTKFLFDYLRSYNFDHLIITGDISDNAEIKELLIFKNLLKNYDLLNSGRVTLTIGNHDIFGGVQTPSDLIKFPQNCSRIDFNERIRRFVSIFGELFEDVYYPDQGDFFPFAKEIGDFVFIGINSIDNYSKFKNPFASNGRVSARQRENLIKILDNERFEGKNKAVLIHHHFYKNGLEVSSSPNQVWNKIESYTLKLRGKKKLLKLFKEHNIKLVMHGHSHEFIRYKRKGIHILNAGGSIDNGENKGVYFFLIELIDNKFEIKEHSLSYPLKSSKTAVEEYILLPELSG